jgi:prepilin-type N-terminal cleavage/methylation domain-containing protein
VGGVVNVNVKERGFSLVEVIVVVAILATVVSFSVGITMDAVKNAKADNATGVLVNAIEVGRNQSTSQRRDFQMIFTLPNKIEIFRVEIPSLALTLVTTAYLEMGQTFTRFGPPLGDTPDLFGHAGAIAFGSTPTIRFTSDGSLIDSAGDILNGTVYVAIDDKTASARAVTIFGATGLIRSWKWNGSAWVN